MLRSGTIGVLAVLAGLVLAVGAFAAPFRAFERAAEDQYTTPSTTTTTAPAPGTTPPPTATATVAVTVGGRTTPTPTAVPSGDVADDTAKEEAGNLDASGGDGDPVPAQGRRGGVSPATGAGAPGPAGGSGATGGGDGRSDIAFLSIGDAPDALREAFVEATGIPQWNADVDEATRDSRLEGRAATLMGDARPLGSSAVPGTGLADGLPDMLDAFEGSVDPIVGLVLARTKLETRAEQRRGDKFVKEFAEAAAARGIPVVGIDLENTDPNNTSYFKSVEGASSVDDVDTTAGAQSLVRLLAGAKPGHYGTDENASAKAPPAVAADRTAASFSDGVGSPGQSPLTLLLLLAVMGLSARALLTVGRRTKLRLR